MSDAKSACLTLLMNIFDAYTLAIDAGRGEEVAQAFENKAFEIELKS